MILIDNFRKYFVNMEKKEIYRIQSLIKEGKLYNEHVRLDKKIEVLSNKSFLTPQEEVEFKNMKLKKLQGKNKIMELIEEN